MFTASFARCQTLKYTLATGHIRLESKRQVALFQGPNEMRAAAVEYEPGAAPGRLPKLLWAAGPGELLVVPGADPSQKFRATWARTLHLRRHDGQPVVTMLGNPELVMTGAGMLAGDRLHLYLRELAAAVDGETSTVVPDRMLVETTSPAARSSRMMRL